MAREHELGRWGEGIAADHLAQGGWSILGRNFRDGPRELDLIVRRGPVVAFVEVKTRSGSDRVLSDALSSIVGRKQLDLARAAARWVRERRPPPGTEYRFDVVLVRGPEDAPRVQHLEDAWRPGF